MNNIENITISIKTSDSENMCKVRDTICGILAGNKDFVESNIIVSDTDCVNAVNTKENRIDDNTVLLIIFKECKKSLSLILKLLKIMLRYIRF